MKTTTQTPTLTVATLEANADAVSVSAELRKEGGRYIAVSTVARWTRPRISAQPTRRSVSPSAASCRAESRDRGESSGAATPAASAWCTGIWRAAVGEAAAS
jgi:hypothetical protein